MSLIVKQAAPRTDIVRHFAYYFVLFVVLDHTSEL